MNEQNQSSNQVNDEPVFTGADGERMISKPIGIALCPTHTKDNWLTHIGYMDNGDGTIGCKVCPWGSMIAGYYRLVGDKVIDLRNVSGNQV